MTNCAAHALKTKYEAASLSLTCFPSLNAGRHTPEGLAAAADMAATVDISLAMAAVQPLVRGFPAVLCVLLLIACQSVHLPWGAQDLAVSRCDPSPAGQAQP